MMETREGSRGSRFYERRIAGYHVEKVHKEITSCDADLPGSHCR